MTERTPDDEIIELAAECQYDPQKWAMFALDWGHGDLAEYDGPREWQAEINEIIRQHLINPKTRYNPLQIAVASGHGIGKSAEMGMLAHWAMSCYDDCKIVTTANTDNQLRTKTAPEIGKWFRMSINAHWFDVQTQSIKIRDKKHSNDWRLDFIPWSEHNTEAFAGLHNKGKIVVLLFDEASKIHDKVWEVAEGALTDENTIIIWIVFGNPTRNSGRFRECFRRYRHRWITRQIDSRDVPGTNKEYLQSLVDDHGVDSDYVKVRVRGMFPSMSVKQFISSADVDAAFGREYNADKYNFAPKILTCDPAWEGDDELVIGMRQGLAFKILRVIQKNDNDIVIAGILAQYEADEQVDAVFIDAGYGTGIVSAGRTLGRDWTLVWFAGESTDAGCLNKRAQMWKDMRDWLKQGGAIPKDDVLYNDLISPETVPRMDGKIQLESKKDMKQRELPSPNRADALALSFAFPVQKRSAMSVSGVQREKALEYNPYQ